MADNKWFANRGQIIQTAFNALACVFSAVKAWPDMRTNELLSAGALLFYALVGLLIYSGLRLVRGLRSAPSRPNDPHTTPRSTLGLLLLRNDLLYILEHYRPLDHDYPNRVKFPLSSAS